MREGEGSRTAERVAIRRAAHQLLDRPPIFEDPLAIRIIDPFAAERLRADPAAFDPSPASPFLRAFFAVRSRFAEDELHVAVAGGVRQYIVLGAGFDTFAYRNPYAELRVFEVDHPATQRRKRERLVSAGIAVPETATFVPVDFTTTRASDALDDAGFDRSAPACVSWLGVTMYLELGAIEQTLQWVAQLPSATSIVFDYAVPVESLSGPGRVFVERLAQRVAAAGEPWQSFFTPEEIHRLLSSSGFGEVEDHGKADLEGRYLRDRTDGLRLGGAARLLCARV